MNSKDCKQEECKYYKKIPKGPSKYPIYKDACSHYALFNVEGEHPAWFRYIDGIESCPGPEPSTGAIMKAQNTYMKNLGERLVRNKWKQE